MCFLLFHGTDKIASVESEIRQVSAEIADVSKHIATYDAKKDQLPVTVYVQREMHWRHDLSQLRNKEAQLRKEKLFLLERESRISASPRRSAKPSSPASRAFIPGSILFFIFLFFGFSLLRISCCGPVI